MNTRHYITEKSLCGPSDPYPCGPCQKLTQMDKKIHKAAIALAALKQERQRLQQQAHQKHTHEPFIYQLPSEIVSAIFELCLLNQRTPLALSTVCRTWRNIAYSTPQLWEKLSLQWGLERPPTPSLVKKWIGRASECLLNIRFSVANIRFNQETADSIIQIIDILNQRSHLWKNLTYDGPLGFLPNFSSGNQNLSQLRTLDIRSCSQYDGRPLDLCCRPLLRLSIASLNPTLAMTTDSNCINLIHLKLEDVLISDCIEALRRAHNLEKCILQRPRRDGINDLQSPPPIIESKIRYLELIDDGDLYHILAYLTCSSLKNLVINRSSITICTVELPVVAEFLRRSGCLLEDFSLLNPETSYSSNYDDDSINDLPDFNTFASLYREMPALEHLRLSFVFPMSTRHVFAPLTEFSMVNGEQRPQCLPSLRSLTLHVQTWNEEASEWQIFPYIFGTRSSGHTMDVHRPLLQSISLDFDTIFHPYFSRSGIDEESMKAILWLRDAAGVNWKITESYYCDLLAVEVERYRRKGTADSPTVTSS
ncbi:hypothetical protein BDN70DRAFT_920396 [Pholiota conissans]|uniref:F-box domain-containing protein n=1 Tax=Pholiota conissans TaxID=109636 RepID=A0A9P5Z5Y4_9AGAR|nr:hypothetical protein BDN70DRAFT_920396 [Pholiota conissans]